MSSKLVPVSRRELIRRLRVLGFDGPFKGSDHDYMVRGEIRVTIPNLHKGQDIGVRLLTQVLKEAEVKTEQRAESRKKRQHRSLLVGYIQAWLLRNDAHKRDLLSASAFRLFNPESMDLCSIFCIVPRNISASIPSQDSSVLTTVFPTFGSSLQK